MSKSIAKHIVVLLTMLAASMHTMAQPESGLEEAVCGTFKEWLAFSLWKSAAGAFDPAAVAQVPNAAAIAHQTVDGRTLRGYKISANGQSKGAVLFAQGNAMLADQLLAPLSVLAESGFDVFVFDFRGYGASNGTPKLKAIVNDYAELANSIRTLSPGSLNFFGVSFGGVVLLNALKSSKPVEVLVVDSTPSLVSDLGCPTSYDPVENVPTQKSMMLVVGERDRVVPASKSFALAERVRTNGGVVEVRPLFAHPFMDTDAAIARARMKLVSDFITANQEASK